MQAERGLCIHHYSEALRPDGLINHVIEYISKARYCGDLLPTPFSRGYTRLQGSGSIISITGLG